jgi:phosphopantetheinyl transferase (holo-ACP synthase)
LIGNDIIDLSLAKTQSNWQRSGFLEKQFTKHEIEAIQKAENSFLLVWRFWSMKEAVYKVVVQQQKKRFFAPKKFECKIRSETKGFVRFEDQTFETTTQTTHKYIYTSVGKATAQHIGPKADEQEILKLIERNTGIPSIQLEIKKTAVGVPELLIAGKQRNYRLTKSHHGAYEAFEIINLNNS